MGHNVPTITIHYAGSTGGASPSANRHDSQGLYGLMTRTFRGHLLGDKVTPEVAAMRETVVGNSLFSPFPFHSVYSVGGGEFQPHNGWRQGGNTCHKADDGWASGRSWRC